jgi:type 2 lantibiotic biosynthesis protein LanM
VQTGNVDRKLGATWCRALSLRERRPGLPQCETQTPDVDIDRACRRKERWRSQAPFEDSSRFAQRLSADEIDENDFLYLLGEPVESLSRRFPEKPTWWTDLEQALSGPRSPLELPEAFREKGFLGVVQPLVAALAERLRQAAAEMIQNQPGSPLDPARIADLFLPDLLRRLTVMLTRPALLELNVARLEGTLEGKTPEQRFESFRQRFQQPDHAIAFFAEYPVLGRQVIRCMQHWLAAIRKFLQHLCTDWEAIRSSFTPETDPGALTAVDATGDPHNGGQCVLVLRFESGFRLVYKPRSLALDLHLQDLLAWINDRGDHPTFRGLRILNRAGHAWVEFVGAHGCASRQEVTRFYERQGAYLALLYALDAADFHLENLIAAGEHPILVDVEALFHPRWTGSEPDEAEDLALNVLFGSVLPVGLLPVRIWATAESEGIDVSGLGGAPGQLSPFAIPDIEKAGTDEMRLTRKRSPLTGAQNRPTLNGAEVDLSEHADAIAAGFARVYRLLWKHREELLSPSGPLVRFAADEVRVILRDTNTYHILLHESFHPDVLRDALERDQLFDRLWFAATGAPHLARVVGAERHDLQNGDIPYFTTRPGSRDLGCSSGMRIEGFFNEVSLDSVRRRLEHFSESDLKLQLWIVRASLATTAPHPDLRPRTTHRVNERGSCADPEQLLRAAQAVGDRLESLALRKKADVSWLGLTLADEQHWSVSPLALDLYDGLPGVTLFLAYLGAVTGESRYRMLAEAACGMMRREVKEIRPFISAIGAFTGWGGLIYTLCHLAALWKQPELLAEAQGLVDLLPPLIDQDAQLDIVGGSAGCIAALLAMHELAPSPATLAAAAHCGDHLLERALTMDRGIGWIPKGMSHALAGFSHGAAGIAWALLKLGAATGKQRFRNAALDAIAYERQLFVPAAGNWRDLRTAEQGGQHFITAWCNGAPGIGLARLSTLPCLDEALVREEIETARDTAIRDACHGSHCLCHGDLGNLEFLSRAAQVLGQERCHPQIERIAGAVLESISRDGWVCGTPSRVESPGLMTGLAGIGYGLLRLAAPAVVPSVLELATTGRQAISEPAVAAGK